MFKNATLKFKIKISQKRAQDSFLIHELKNLEDIPETCPEKSWYGQALSSQN